MFLCLSSRGLAEVLPPVGQNFEKLHFLENESTLAKQIAPFKHRSSKGAAFGGSDFWKMALPCKLCQFWWKKLLLSSRGLARVLPPAGQIFEKLHFLEIFCQLWRIFVPFKQGSSRGAASGGSDFFLWESSTPLRMLPILAIFLCLSGRGLAEVLPPCPPVSLAGLYAGLSVSWPWTHWPTMFSCNLPALDCKHTLFFWILVLLHARCHAPENNAPTMFKKT